MLGFSRPVGVHSFFQDTHWESVSDPGDGRRANKKGRVPIVRLQGCLEGFAPKIRQRKGCELVCFAIQWGLANRHPSERNFWR